MINSPSLYLIVRAYLCYQLKIKVVLAHSNSAGFRCFIFSFFMKLDLNVSLSFHVEPNVLFCFSGGVKCHVLYFFFIFFFIMSLEAQLIF